MRSRSTVTTVDTSTLIGQSRKDLLPNRDYEIRMTVSYATERLVNTMPIHAVSRGVNFHPFARLAVRPAPDAQRGRRPLMAEARCVRHVRVSHI